MTTKSTVMLKKSMTKNKYRELCSSRRCVSGFNTGTRIHKSARDYKRVKRGWDIYE